MSVFSDLLFAAPTDGVAYWLPLIAIIVGSILVFLLLIAFAISLLVNSIIFTRQDKIPNVKYFTPEDFGVRTEELAVNYRGRRLYAKLYSVKPLEQCERVVIFSHGFGAGSSSYMTEICYLAKQGFAVAAADAYGCNNSAGKSVLGFYAGAEAVVATYIAVRAVQSLKDKKIVLMGHSWGAYSVLCASKRVAADGVVALSALNAPAQCVSDNLRAIGGIARLYAPLLHPWFFVINALRFGAKGNTHAAKAVQKCGVKTLIIHGEKDRTVPIKHSAAAKAKGSNITVLKLADKKHNPYNTVRAEEKLAELMGGKRFESENEAKEYFDSFDWNAATEEDEAVMGKIKEFILSV